MIVLTILINFIIFFIIDTVLKNSYSEDIWGETKEYHININGIRCKKFNYRVWLRLLAIIISLIPFFNIILLIFFFIILKLDDVIIRLPENHILFRIYEFFNKSIN